ncbi:MAG: dienelactone hydrolase family protein [Janthinobacterium lividum]
MTTNSEWIDIPADGGTYQGYLALPPADSRDRKGPGIILLQEIFGVNAHIRSVADQYAADGYVVLAPDIFWRSEKRVELGYEGDDMKKAVSLMQATDVGNAVSDVAAAVKALKTRPELQGNVTAIGYCFGGRLAYLSAANGLVDAGVAYYGGGIQNMLDKAAQVKVPMLFHYAEHDHNISLEAVEQVKAAFAGHPDATFHVYPGAEHGFNCNVRGSYQRHAAALAHGRTLAFLEK